LNCPLPINPVGRSCFHHFFVFQYLAAGGCHQSLLKPEKPIRATAAKEVGMKNPAEKTAVRPNQNPCCPRPRLPKGCGQRALN
jgi:hypothetical protein